MSVNQPVVLELRRVLSKAGKFAVGTIRTWKDGKKYRKTAQGWVEEAEAADASPRKEDRQAALSPEVMDVLVSHVESRGNLNDAIADFAGAGDRTLYVCGGKISAKRLAGELRSWKPEPIPKGEEMVTVHHNTTRENANRLLADGAIKEMKPWTLASRRHAAGEAATFAPGAGVERGLYVGAPGTTTGFGRVTLEIQVPASWLSIPAELTALGHKDDGDTAEASKTEHGALVRRSIPPSAIKEISKSLDPFLDLVKGGPNPPEPVVLELRRVLSKGELLHEEPRIMTHDAILFIRRHRPELWAKIQRALGLGLIVIAPKRRIYTLLKGSDCGSSDD